MIYFDLLSGVTSLVRAVSGSVPVSMRYDLFMLSAEKAPLIIVAPGTGFEKMRMNTFNRNVVYDYPILVAYVTAGDRNINENLQDYLDRRESIRNQLYQIKPVGLQTTWDTKMEPDAVSKFASLAGSAFRVTGWEVNYSVAEVRKGT